MLGEYGLGEFALGEFAASDAAPSRTLIWPCEVAVDNTGLRFADPPTLDASALLAGGSKGLLFSGNNNEQECTLQWFDSGPTAIDETTVYLTLYVRWIDGAGDIWFRTFGGSIVAGVSVDDAGDLLLEGTTTDAPTESLGDQEIHRLDIKFVRNGACELQVDGGTAATVTGEDVATDCINMVFGSATNFEFHADAVWISTAEFAPAGYAMTSLRPTGNGANVDGFDDVVVGSGTTFAEIDDDTVDNDTTKLASNVLSANDRSFTCTNLPTLSYDTIDYVQAVAVAADAVSFTSDVQVYIGDDAAIISAAENVNTDYQYIGVGSALDGASAAWTETSVNNAEVGFLVTTVTQVLKVTAAWLDVVYTLVPNLTATLSGVVETMVPSGLSSALTAALASARFVNVGSPLSSALSAGLATAPQRTQQAATNAHTATYSPQLRLEPPQASWTLTVTPSTVPLAHQASVASSLFDSELSPSAQREASASTLAATVALSPELARHSSTPALTGTIGAAPAQSNQQPTANTSHLSAVASPSRIETATAPALAATVTLAPEVARQVAATTLAGAISAAPSPAAHESRASLALTATLAPSPLRAEPATPAGAFSVTLSGAVLSAIVQRASVTAPPPEITISTIQQLAQVLGFDSRITATMSAALARQTVSTPESRFTAAVTGETLRTVTQLQRLGLLAEFAPSVAQQETAGLSSTLLVAATPAQLRQLDASPESRLSAAVSSCRMVHTAGPAVVAFSAQLGATVATLAPTELRLFLAALLASAPTRDAAYGVAAVFSATLTAAKQGIVGPAVTSRFTVAVTSALQRWLPGSMLGELVEVPLVTTIQDVRVAVSGETIFWKLTPAVAVTALTLSWARDGGAVTVVESIEGTHNTGDSGSWYGYFAPTLPPGQASGLWRWTARGVIGGDELVLKAGILRVVKAP